MRLRVYFALLLALGGLASMPGVVLAQYPYTPAHSPGLARLPVVEGPSRNDPQIQELLRRQQAADQRIFELQSQLQRQQTPYELTAASLPADQSVLSSITAEKIADDGKGKDEGGWTNVSGQNWNSRIGGVLNADYVLFTQQNAGSAARFGDVDNYFEFRRIRLFMQGEGYGVFDYRLELDFEPDGASLLDTHDTGVALLDAYLGMRDVPLLGYVRAGHFREPMSIEQLTYGTDITFLERSLADIFAPGRNVGVAMYNNNAVGSIGWAFGVFFEDGLNRTVDDREHQQISDNQGIRLTPRIFASPYYCDGGRHLVHLGTSFSYVDDRDNMVRFSARPEVHESARFIDTGAAVANDYTVFQTEGAVVWGNWSLQSEFFYTHTNSGLAATDMNLYGAYAYLSWFVTGEHRNYDRQGGYFGRLTPHSNFWIVNAVDGVSTGPGAWEVALRWSYLDLADGAHPNAGLQNDITLGVNWYWTAYTRMMFNWIHSYNKYNVPVGGFSNAEADSISMRMQFDW